MRKSFIFFSAITIVCVAGLAILVSDKIWHLFWLIGPIVLLGIYDMLQKKKSILRNFPIAGHGRYISEWLRPKIYQYFVESDYDGRPVNRIYREMIYNRAENKTDTIPFGTQLLTYEEGYEWMNHSITPLHEEDLDFDPRVMVGGSQCKKPYNCSLFNISAMSYGSLSKTAIMALNGGAAIGNFAHNTGEGGISPYHNKFEGDLIYQVGTGYFGCRSAEGRFDPDLFKEVAAADNVKMIELKLSQGAKPGHGGILPAEKATKEIAKIRNIEPFKAVLSPPYHKEFSSPTGLLEFIQKMRELSGGKPVGFKLCIGHQAEFLSICKAIIKTGIKPDFISVDGGEGGTGAAPVEFSNSVGMPSYDGIAFVYNALEGFGIKEDIRIIASGKVFTGFHIFRAMALGADACYSARAMMLALGCIQALECHKNTCPTGVATQDPSLSKGLSVDDKKLKVANYQRRTIKNFVELLGASGLDDPDKINRAHIYRRVEMNRNMRFDQIYPYITKGCLLNEETVPEHWKMDMGLCSADKFLLGQPLEKYHL